MDDGDGNAGGGRELQLLVRGACAVCVRAHAGGKEEDGVLTAGVGRGSREVAGEATQN